MDPLIGFPKPKGAAPAAQSGSGHPDIVDASTETFMKEVVEDSLQRPVIVDFWAPWCGPCKALTPALEKTVKAAAGQVKLVKVNIDENPEIAQQMRIQSIPAVYAFAGGRPIDGFVGQQPESQVKQFVERLVQAVGGQIGPTPSEELVAAAKAAQEAGDIGTAVDAYAQALEQDPELLVAMVGLAGCYLELGEVEAAEALLAEIPADKVNDPGVASIRAKIELGRKAAGMAAELHPLLAAVEANPADFDSRLKLAEAQFAMGEVEAAMDQLLYIIEKNRAWNDEAARKQLLQFFEALGPMHEHTIAGRRRLSSLLFS